MSSLENINALAEVLDEKTMKEINKSIRRGIRKQRLKHLGKALLYGAGTAVCYGGAIACIDSVSKNIHDRTKERDMFGEYPMRDDLKAKDYAKAGVGMVGLVATATGAALSAFGAVTESMSIACPEYDSLEGINSLLAKVDVESLSQKELDDIFDALTSNKPNKVDLKSTKKAS